MNVKCGAVAIGHPIGASGARILVTQLYELQRRNLKRGTAALCLGVENAVSLAIERILCEETQSEGDVRNRWGLTGAEED